MPKTREMEQTAEVREKMVSPGEILTTVAHEIGNPISALNLYFSSLETILAGPGPLDEATRRRTEAIVQSMRCNFEKVGRVGQRIADLRSRLYDEKG